jgi:hypothetical protein
MTLIFIALSIIPAPARIAQVDPHVLSTSLTCGASYTLCLDGDHCDYALGPISSASVCVPDTSSIVSQQCMTTFHG